MNATFADLLTPTGMAIAMAGVTTLVEIIKTVFPLVNEKVSGLVLAFFFSLILYVLTAVATGLPTWDAGLTVFFAWLGVAAGAVGVHQATTRAVTAARSPRR